MKLALIPPTSHVSYAAMSDLHLVLAQELGRDMYRAFYQDVRNRGRSRIILDNGAHERSGPLPMIDVLKRALQIGGIDELVMPDVQQDGPATVRETQRAADYLTSEQGAELFFTAGRPDLMLVPQGVDFDEWCECLERLLEQYERIVDTNLIETAPIIGIGKKHSMYFSPGYMYEELAERELDFHLLGWVSPGHVELAKNLGARSIDTARPFLYTINEIDVQNGIFTDERVFRPQEYFARPWVLDAELLYGNISFFLEAVK